MPGGDRQRATWEAGDYPDVARTIEEVSPVTVAAAGVGAGDEVLDVATGTGNTALVAARLGARVTGLDIVPGLLEVARERAAAEGLQIRFVEGDAAALPFAAASFDRVTSVFGAMFAADQPETAAEMLRVCRPGGTIAVTAFTARGLNGQMFATVARHHKPPPGFRPPVLWGDEDHVRALFAGAAGLTFELRTYPIVGASPAGWVDYLSRVLGPLAQTRQALEAEGRWGAARDDLVALYSAHNEATDGTLYAPAEYLLTVVAR
jgi:SAM-dependent methyltransferase